MTNTNKKKILIFIDWFIPGFKAGGPIKSVLNIVSSLHNEFDFYILTSDRDINETSSYKNVELNNWIKKDNYSIIYLSPDNRDQWISAHLKKKNYDSYYFNSLFSRNFTLKPLLILNKLNKDSLIIAPRGMLGKGALSIKPAKKKLFIWLAKRFGYYRNVVWHATNIEEKKDIINNFGNKTSIKIASNINLSIILKQEIPKTTDDLKLVFFSRISPKKNLNYVLDIINGDKSISLDIYGSIEDAGYWEKCMEMINQNQLTIKYKGELIPKDVNSVLSNYHFFILPTLHENYGHVIVEALTAGCGLIISDNTPWRNLASKNIGWDISLEDPDQFKKILEECISLNQTDYNSIRNNCYSFVEKEINSQKEITDTKNLFNSI